MRVIFQVTRQNVTGEEASCKATCLSSSDGARPRPRSFIPTVHKFLFKSEHRLRPGLTKNILCLGVFGGGDCEVPVKQGNVNPSPAMEEVDCLASDNKLRQRGD